VSLQTPKLRIVMCGHRTVMQMLMMKTVWKGDITWGATRRYPCMEGADCGSNAVMQTSFYNDSVRSPVDKCILVHSGVKCIWQQVKLTHLNVLYQNYMALYIMGCYQSVIKELIV